MIELKKEQEYKFGDLASGFFAQALASNQLPRNFKEFYENKKEYERYKQTKRQRLNKLKGGNEIMETKSRYEVISELEERKREYIIQRDNLGNRVKEKTREIKNLKRELEDKEEDLKEFKESLSKEEETINELIKSVDESLKRFSELQKKS